MAFQRANGTRRGITLEIEIPLGEDVNLAAVIAAVEPVKDDKTTILLSVASTVCHGSSAATIAAITTGDLTGWKRVELDIPNTSSGQGKGGAGGTGGAGQTDDNGPVGDGTDGQIGGSALRVTDASILYMTQASQDRLFGGGGGAGGGGGGGVNNYYIWDGWQGDGWWDDGSSGSFINYNGSRVYTGTGHVGLNGDPFDYGGKRYDRGWNRTDNSPDYSQPALFEVNRGTFADYTGGVGGFGGRGAGSCLGATLGDPGTLGEDNNAGKGGDGGDGGALRTVGEAGEDGAPRDGQAGTGGAGGQPGTDIDIISGSIITF